MYAPLLNPIVTKMHKKGIPRIVGSLLVYTVFLVFIYIFLRILIPTLYTQINDLIATFLCLKIMLKCNILFYTPTFIIEPLFIIL